MYLQTSEGLRPAKIIFPGADEEKLENIARVSLKTTDKFVPPVPSRQRKKSSKNESNTDEQYQKPCVSKNSPVKDNIEDGGKAVVKSKRAIKSPSKAADKKRGLKRSGSTDRVDVNTKKMRVTQYKNKRERKSDKQEIKSEYVNSHIIEDTKSGESLCTDSRNSVHVKETTENDGSNIETETLNDNTNLTDSFDEVKNVNNSGSNINTKPWTRQEDMILLQAIKREYSENSFSVVSKILGDRTIDQVSRFILFFAYFSHNITN